MFRTILLSMFRLAKKSAGTSASLHISTKRAAKVDSDFAFSWIGLLMSEGFWAGIRGGTMGSVLSERNWSWIS